MGEPQRRYSLACRTIAKAGVTVKAGHGGRWGSAPDEPCPRCGRQMVVTGVVLEAALTGSSTRGEQS